MQPSIATISNSGDFSEKLATIAEAGFDGVEIFEQDSIAYDGSPTDVGNLVRDHGLEIVQRVNGSAGYGAANAPHRTAALKRSVQAAAA